MTKYLEIGFGNTYVVRTEYEDALGHEWEVKGWVGPVRCRSVYCRLWLGTSVFILDSREGIKRQRKSNSRFKLVFGLVSD